MKQRKTIDPKLSRIMREPFTLAGVKVKFRTVSKRHWQGAYINIDLVAGRETDFDDVVHKNFMTPERTSSGCYAVSPTSFKIHNQTTN